MLFRVPGVDVPLEVMLKPLAALFPLRPLTMLAVSDAGIRGVCEGVGAREEYVDSAAGGVR